ncbi:hypothetical protein H6G80_35075 [Nostoc sp. FACHB-87]|uniref:hypothetical protein n=1 Tax=Nostocales TaxID=1161 RepID=UPI001687AB82|nr:MULTISPECIES: hypothetical protein [Nostocales]MBD2459247.1 hypothetical protein [Nostoc sp. FACHB-87]MBD2480248.1 hypothetical protein [Anabaena sp. FACHB-83]MBD2490430.1 hypothetical protein [Aulosira sp. FACHB-615]
MSWIKLDDTVLWVVIAISYRYIDWSQPQLKEEWHIIRQLVAKEYPVLDPAIFWSLQQLAPYNSDLVVFYNLSREIILRTQNEDIKSYIYCAINSTPDVVEGAMSNFYKKRIEEISHWLTDDNIHVKLFARQIIQYLQINIESEEGIENLRERNW